jgi:hypothetical protein
MQRRHAISLAVAFVLTTSLWLPTPTIAASRYNWVPRDGLSVMTNNYNGTTWRRLYQNFRWTTSSQLSALQGSNVTLEVETHVRCVSGACWVRKPRYPPARGAAWDTNMPAGYLDTQVDDDPNLPNLTVGSSDTRGMVALHYYWTWILAYPESATTGTGSSWFQIGHRDPSWCSSTWCIFPDDTVPVIPNWLLPLPGSRGWVWP